MAHDHATGWSTRVREYSLPLIVGVIAGLVVANIDSHWYHELIEHQLAGLQVFGHALTPHFLINDIFMVFFFGVAAKEITDGEPAGRRAQPDEVAPINPLLGTLGGVFGPVGVFFALTLPAVRRRGPELAAVANGWGIPTATDIALAWLCARLVFGAKPPGGELPAAAGRRRRRHRPGHHRGVLPRPGQPGGPAHLLWWRRGMGSRSPCAWR